MMVALGTRCTGDHRRWHIRVQRPRKPHSTKIGLVRVNVDGVNNFYYLPTRRCTCENAFSHRKNAFPKNTAPKPRTKFRNTFLNQMHFELSRSVLQRKFGGYSPFFAFVASPNKKFVEIVQQSINKVKK